MNHLDKEYKELCELRRQIGISKINLATSFYPNKNKKGEIKRTEQETY